MYCRHVVTICADNSLVLCSNDYPSPIFTSPYATLPHQTLLYSTLLISTLPYPTHFYPTLPYLTLPYLPTLPLRVKKPPHNPKATLFRYDRIACFLDNRNPALLHDSREELNGLLSDPVISQPIVIFVPSENASGYPNDPESIAEYGLEDVIRKGKGRIAVFAYSLSLNKFVGCLESQLFHSRLSAAYTDFEQAQST